MKKFLDENFLLQTPTAEYLYHQHAAHMPVIDYHCHLSPGQLARNEHFENITQAWLYGDHYKWRAMRTNGVEEHYCTGNATDQEKFQKWAETVPYTLRNPLYHWTHLELQRYFGITDLLGPETAAAIYDRASALLQQKDYTPMELLRKMHVEIVCTTDDPLDSLEDHKAIRERGETIRIIPAWRPDKLLAINDPALFNPYLDQLSAVSGISIHSYHELLEAVKIRHDFFHAAGCRLSDHGLEHFYAQEYTLPQLESVISKARNN